MRNCVPRVSSGCVALGLCVPPPLHLLDDNLCNIFQLLFVASAAAFFIFIFLIFFIVVCVAFCFWLMEYLKKKSRVNSWLRPRNSFRGDRNETVPTRSTWFSQCRVMFLEIYIFSIAVVKELVNMQMRLCFRGSGAIQVVSSIESRCFRTILKGRFFVFDKERSSN